MKACMAFFIEVPQSFLPVMIWATMGDPASDDPPNFLNPAELPAKFEVMELTSKFEYSDTAPVLVFRMIAFISSDLVNVV